MSIFFTNRQFYTHTNLAQLVNAGLGQGIKAGPNDLIIAVKGDEAACQEAMTLARELLSSKPQEAATDGVFAPNLVSLDMALERHQHDQPEQAPHIAGPGFVFG